MPFSRRNSRLPVARRAPLILALAPWLFAVSGCQPAASLPTSEEGGAVTSPSPPSSAAPSVATASATTQPQTRTKQSQIQPPAASGSAADSATPSEPVEPNSQVPISQVKQETTGRPALTVEDKRAVLLRMVSANNGDLSRGDKPVSQAALPIGVVIGFPVVTPPAADRIKDFATACGLYLTVTVAGNGAFGQTPVPFSFERATAKWQQRIPPEAVPAALKGTGATHALVGTFMGGDDAKGATLSYQWYTAGKDGKAAPTGKPMELKGTLAQIAAGLPEFARRLQQPLAPPDPAFAPGLNADEMARIGQMEDSPLFTEAQTADLTALVAKSPFAAYFAVGCAHGIGGDTAKQAAAATLKALPLNAIAWAQIGKQHPDLLAPYRSDLAKAEAKFPKNYPLIQAHVWLERAAGKPDAEMALAEKSVRLAPRNPDAFLSLAYTLGEAGNAVRQGLPASFITPQMQAFLDRMYPRWQAAAQRAADLDPTYVKAWARLAMAATFNGDGETARNAFDKAFALDPYSPDVLAWGMQMFQPKWFGDEDRLRQVADATVTAAARGLLPYTMIRSQSQALKAARLTDARAKLLSNVLAAGDARVARNPKDVQGHYLRALALVEQGDVKGATEAYRAVIALQPNNADAHFALGWFLNEKGRYAEAVPELKETIRLAPGFVQGHSTLSHVLKEMGRLAEAERAAKAAINADPKQGDGYDVLGTVYLFEKKPDLAIAAYRKALSISPDYPEAYNNLIVLYGDKKDWANCAWAAENLLRLRPNDTHLLENLGYYYTQIGRDADAETLNRGLIEQNPNYGNYHDNLGIALAHQGKVAEANTEWDRAVQLGGAPEMMNEIAEMRKKYPKP